MRTITIGLITSATLALAACSGDGGPGPTAGSDSASSKSSSPSAPPSTSTDTGKPFDAKEFTSRLEKAVDDNPTVKVAVTADVGQAEPAKASGVQDLEADSLDMTLNLSGTSFAYRLVDGQYYLSRPPQWVPISEDTTDPVMKQALNQVSVLSVRRQLDAFIAGVESAGIKGTEKIDGVSTTHYTATVNTEKALGKLGIPKATSTPETVIYDVWLDKDDLIRKMSFTQNGANATLVASKWGEPVKITKPKDSELAKVN